MTQQSAARVWAWRLARLAVIAVALAYIVWKVDLQDHALLADGKTSVVVYDAAPDESRLRVDLDGDGQLEWRDAAEFSRPKTKIPGQQLPLVAPGLKRVMTKVDWSWTAYAFAIFAPNYVFLAWRLRLLLKTQDVRLRRRDAVKVSFASAFLNFAVPTGTTGGDIYKAWYVAAHATGRRTEAVTVVLLDRAIGLINFIFMAALVSLVSWMTGRVGALGGFVATMFTVSIVGACAFFSQRVRRLVRLETWLPRLPFGSHLVRIDRTAFSLRYHPRTLVSAFGWTIIVQTGCCVAVMFLARAVGMRCNLVFGDVSDYLLAIIVGLTVASLPGNPPQGFGVLEGIIAYILEPHYGNFAQIFAVCIGLRLLHLVWSLPGAAVLLIEPRPRPPAVDAESPSVEAPETAPAS